LYNKDVIAEVLDWLINSQSQVSGFFDSVALENLFKNLLPSAEFGSSAIDLYITATALDSRKRAIFNSLYDFEDGENHFMTDVPIHKAVRASSAVPGMFEPVKIKGSYYIDGEVKRTLSADIGVSLADRVIMSHTYQPLFLESKGTIKDLGWLNILKQSATMILHERIARWRESYEEHHPEKEIIWIQPEEDDMEFFLAPEFSFRPEIQKMMIQRGEQAALRAIGALQPESISDHASQNGYSE
jgi:predicted acylesterase/phospholipase RssA